MVRQLSKRNRLSEQIILVSWAAPQVENKVPRILPPEGGQFYVNSLEIGVGGPEALPNGYRPLYLFPKQIIGGLPG